MSSIPSDLRYTETHEWVRVESGVAIVGITDYAQESLGDVVFVDLPKAGDKLTRGEEAGEIESVKAVSNLYAPLSGEVLESNEDLVDAPETINSEPYDAGWMYKIKLSNPAELDKLLDAKGYKGHLEAQD